MNGPSSSGRRPAVAVGAVVVDNEELLLVRRSRPPAEGTWSVPGGHLERGETLAEAVVRELTEETGLEGACGELVGWTELLGGDHHTVILDFWVHLLERADLRPGDDASEARWVALGEVAEMRLAPGLAELLHDHGVITTIV